MKKICLFLLCILLAGPRLYASELNIGFTGNNRGLLTPCGCKIPSGGWARISTLKKQLDEPLLMVAAGNHFFHHTPMPKEDQIFQQKKAHFQADMFNKLEYDVINAGEFDLCYGLNVLTSMQETFELPIISANILDMDGERVFPEYKIIEHDGMNIMFIGLCQLDDGFNYKIADPLQTLFDMHEKGLFEQADLVILLADATAKILSDFVKECEGIDIIIAAKEHAYTDLPIHYKKTALIQMGSQGKHFGILDLHFKKVKAEWADITPQRFKLESVKTHIKESTYEKRSYRRKLKKAGKNIKSFEKEHPLYYGLKMIQMDESVKDDPTIKETISKLQ